MKNNQKKAEYIDGEIWKPIKQYEKGFMYEVSNLGRVRNAKNHGLMNFEQRKGRGTCDKKEGYYSVRLWNFETNKRRWFLLHRLIAEVFIPNPNNMECVNHIDGNKLNNKLSNLEWCSIAENNRHARKMGLNKGGFKPLVSHEERKNIEKYYSCGMRVSEIAKLYGVTTSCIYIMKARNQIVLKRQNKDENITTRDRTYKKI